MSRIFFVVLCLFSFSALATIITDNRPAFHADVLINNGGEIINGKHYQGPNGFRFETVSPGIGKVTIIANYKQQVCRVYFDFNKTYTEELLNLEHEGCDMGMEEMMANAPGAGHGANYYTLSSIEPCSGFDMKRKVGTEEVSGHMTEQWQCVDTKNGIAAIQWFEPKMRHVIKHQGEFESEQYTNIVLKPVPNALLAKIDGYKKTTSEALMKDLMGTMQKQMQGQMQMPGGMGMPQY